MMLPLRLEALPEMESFFDTVFCMGILYHQRDPEAALRRIARLLRSGGELVLETLVVEGDGDGLAALSGRYAKMNNVYAGADRQAGRKLGGVLRLQANSLRRRDAHDAAGAAADTMDAV